MIEQSGNFTGLSTRLRVSTSILLKVYIERGRGKRLIGCQECTSPHGIQRQSTPEYLQMSCSCLTEGA